MGGAATTPGRRPLRRTGAKGSSRSTGSILKLTGWPSLTLRRSAQHNAGQAATGAAGGAGRADLRVELPAGELAQHSQRGHNDSLRADAAVIAEELPKVRSKVAEHGQLAGRQRAASPRIVDDQRLVGQHPLAAVLAQLRRIVASGRSPSALTWSSSASRRQLTPSWPGGSNTERPRSRRVRCVSFPSRRHMASRRGVASQLGWQVRQDSLGVLKLMVSSLGFSAEKIEKSHRDDRSSFAGERSSFVGLAAGFTTLCSDPANSQPFTVCKIARGYPPYRTLAGAS